MSVFLGNDRIKGTLRTIIRHVMAFVHYHPMYTARVVAQTANGRVDIKPESSIVPEMKGVELRHGLPGMRVRVRPGARVLVGFEDGDPSKPYAALWGEPVVTVRARASTTAAATIAAGSTLAKPSDPTKTYVVLETVSTNAAASVTIKLAPQGEGAGYSLAAGDTLDFAPALVDVAASVTVVDALPSPQSPVESITFDNGSASVARVGDSVALGDLYAVITAGSISALFYRAPGGAWVPVATGASPPIGNVGTSMAGEIDSGNPKLKA